ncbi:MAG: hypothetical protein HYW78_01945 [Parcubacteria group bacterium]|nr:hypothetical protein [Parcubacteria group bacterium]
MKPYIGVTGFMYQSEVVSALSALPKQSSRKLMIGVLASSKTVNRKQNKHPRSFPKIETIEDIFIDHPNALNLIHYSTDDDKNLESQLILLRGFGGKNLHGFQLNITWPELRALDLIKKFFPDLRLVLQVGSKAFEMIEYDIKKFGKKLNDYRTLIDAVLIDPSGGKGKSFDLHNAYHYIDTVATLYPSLGIGIAGGLCAETVDRIEPLIERFPYLNIDAQGKLRDENDNLCLADAVNYITRALSLFGMFGKGIARE